MHVSHSLQINHHMTVASQQGLAYVNANGFTLQALLGYVLTSP